LKDLDGFTKWNEMDNYQGILMILDCFTEWNEMDMKFFYRLKQTQK